MGRTIKSLETPELYDTSDSTHSSDIFSYNYSMYRNIFNFFVHNTTQRGVKVRLQ